MIKILILFLIELVIDQSIMPIEGLINATEADFCGQSVRCVVCREDCQLVWHPSLTDKNCRHGYLLGIFWFLRMFLALRPVLVQYLAKIKKWINYLFWGANLSWVSRLVIQVGIWLQKYNRTCKNNFEEQ